MDDVTILADLRQIIDLQQVFMRGRVGSDKRMSLRFFCDITIAQTLLYRIRQETSNRLPLEGKSYSS